MVKAAKKWTPKKTKKALASAVEAVKQKDMSLIDENAYAVSQKGKADKAAEKGTRSRSVGHEREAKLLFLQKMLFRQVPTADICRTLNIGDRQLRRMKTELRERTLADVKEMNFPHFVGETLNFYNEVRAMALFISSSNKIEDPKVKLHAMNQAIQAEDSKHKFLSLCGVYKSSTAEQFVKDTLTAANSDQKGGDGDVKGIMNLLAHSIMKAGNIKRNDQPMLPEVVDAEFTEGSDAV